MPDIQTSQDTGEADRSMTGSGKDYFSSIASQIVQGDRQLKADTVARQKQIEGAMSEADAASARLQGRIDDLSKSFDKQIQFLQENKAPQAQIRSPLEAFGSTAAVIGALAGLLTRRPLTTGLNAAAAAITSARQGDWENYKLQYNNWKANTDQALQVFDLQNQQLKTIIDSEKLSVDQKLAKARMLGELNHDQVQVQAAQTGDLLSLAQLQTTRERMGEQWAVLQPKIEAEHQRLLALKDVTNSDAFKNADPLTRARMINEVTVPGVAAAEERAAFLSQKQTAADQKNKQVVVEGQSLLKSVSDLKQLISIANAGGVPTGGKLGLVQKYAEAYGLSSGDIATVVDADKNALRIRAESFLRRARPNRWAEDQLQGLVKSYGLGETDKATVDGLDALQQVIKDEMSVAGSNIDTTASTPATGESVLPTLGKGVSSDGVKTPLDDAWDSIMGH